MTRLPRALRSLVLLTCCADALAGDWPQWRGPARDGHVPAGVAVPEALPAAPKVVWHAAVGFGLASPVVAGGKVLYLDNEGDKDFVGAADAGSGKGLWHVELDESARDSQSQPPARGARRWSTGTAFTRSPTAAS